MKMTKRRYRPTPLTFVAAAAGGLLASPACAAPTISSAPTGTWNLLAGGAPIYRVKAVGTEPITYSWLYNGAAIAGNGTATTSALALMDSTVASSGNYSVTVTDPTGSVTSTPFTVNFTAPPAGDSYAAKVLADHPTAYWRLGEAAGTALTDPAGGHQGTYNLNRIERTITGPRGIIQDTATRFKLATAGVSASVPYTPNVNPAGAFSIECWARPDLSGNTGSAVLSTQNRSAGRAGYVIYQGNSGNFWDAHLGAGGSFVSVQGRTKVVAGRWDHLVLTWNGQEPGTASLYVNGHLEGSMAFVLPFRHNEAQALEIGSRSGGALPFAGAVDEVAVYQYELTVEQVENHFSISYFLPAFTAQPVPAASAMEAGTITLTAEVTGFPNTYEWLKDGNPLSAFETNPDGSKKYPQGVTGTTLVISQASDPDAGRYHLAVSNPLGGSESDGTVVSVAPDITPPTVAYVTASPTPGRVRVGFSKPMSPDTLMDPASYTFTGGLTATGVYLTVDPAVINLSTSGMIPGGNYSLSISGVQDARTSQNTIGPNQTPFAAYQLTPGLLAWDFYRNVPGAQVSNLRSDFQYPDGVWTHRFVNSFSTMSVTTGGDLSTNPDFSMINPVNGSRIGEFYGARVYGWITPVETAEYTFFLRSDDGSEFWISTDSSPENVVLAASQGGCCNAFSESGSLYSQPIPFVAGQSYFVEGLYKEGGGGDYLEVAWRKQGDLTAPNTLQPVPAAFLSAYAQVVGTLHPPVVAGSQVTLTWTGSGRLQESADLGLWNDVPGNPASGYVATLPPGTVRRYYRLKL